MHPAQLHLDLVFDDPRAAVAALRRLGAVRLAAKAMHAVFADPAGHPFCGPASGYVTAYDIPPGVTSVQELPADWDPQPLPLTRGQVVEAVLDAAPDAEFPETGSVRVTRPGLELEISIPDGELFKSFVLSFGAADRTVVDPILREILGRLDVRAFDADAPGQIFIQAT